MPGNRFLNTIISQIPLGSDGHVLTVDDSTMNGVVFKAPAVTPATTNASDLTSGTLNAARLPGVLANVSTQPQLLSASGAAAPTKYARLSRVSSDQSNVSGAWAQDYLQYNEITEDTNSLIASISGDDITIATAGMYLILQHVYDLIGFFNVSVDGAGVLSSDMIQYTPNTTGLYMVLPWLIRTTGSNKVLKMGFFSAAIKTFFYSDGTRAGNSNYLEILKLG